MVFFFIPFLFKFLFKPIPSLAAPHNSAQGSLCCFVVIRLPSQPQLECKLAVLSLLSFFF
jgi:hypothetical protein